MFVPRIQNELGHACDHLGRYDEAFASFERCGAARLEQAVAQRCDRARWLDRIERYRRGLDRDLLARWSPADVADEFPPIAFLVGFPRSGTTMTERVLGSHPGIATSDEQPFLADVDHELTELFAGVEDRVTMLRRLELPHIRRLRTRYWQSVGERMDVEPDDRLFLDKLPLQIVELGLINVIFPDARIIVALRDPRDVCLSCLMQMFALNDAMVNFTSMAHTVEAYERVMDFWLHVRELITLPFVEVRYEDTVVDLEAQARRMLELLELPWEESVLAFHERSSERVISTPSYAAVSEPVHTRATERWRNYEPQIHPYIDRLQRFIEAFGYDGEPR
jgi:hypothetical protein